MLEPDSEANTVPEVIATSDRRPGTPAMARSIARMACVASPVASRISPISTNSGIGTSTKLPMASVALSARSFRPAAPPRMNHAPARLIAKKAKATGTPIPIRKTSAPPIRPRMASQPRPVTARGHPGPRPRSARP